MNARILALGLTAVLALAPRTAQSQTAVSISGGVNAPLGDLGDIADLGYNAAVGLHFGGTVLPVGVRLEGAYNGLQLKDGGGDIRIISATANAVFNIGKTADAPYLIAGLGAYNRRLTLDPFGSSDRTVVGINGGAGLRFPLSGISTFVEARYHIMLGKTAEATSYQFIPITFGVVF